MSAGARPPAERIPAKQRHAPLRLRAVERTQRAMKDQWYGDKRDLVKWGVLLRLAHLYGASRILQVAYYGESAWGWLEIDGQPKPMDEVVIDHFRNIRNIRKLTAQLRIDVITSPFSDRQRYTRKSYAKSRHRATSPSYFWTQIPAWSRRAKLASSTCANQSSCRYGPVCEPVTSWSFINTKPTGMHALGPTASGRSLNVRWAFHQPPPKSREQPKCPPTRECFNSLEMLFFSTARNHPAGSQQDWPRRPNPIVRRIADSQVGNRLTRGVARSAVGIPALPGTSSWYKPGHAASTRLCCPVALRSLPAGGAGDEAVPHGLAKYRRTAR